MLWLYKVAIRVTPAKECLSGSLKYLWLYKVAIRVTPTEGQSQLIEKF